MNDINDSILFFINDLAGKSRLFDEVMIFSSEVLIYVLFAVAAAVLLAAAYKKQGRRRIILFLIALAATYVLLSIFAELHHSNRPFVDHELTQLVEHEKDDSFPSNHVASAFAIAFGFLLFFSRKVIGYAFLAAAIVVGFARIYTGIHYPFDIGASVLIAIAAVVLIFASDRLRHQYQHGYFENMDSDR